MDLRFPKNQFIEIALSKYLGDTSEKILLNSGTILFVILAIFS